MILKDFHIFPILIFKASPKKYETNLNDDLRERLFEVSGNTIQAGDPSILMPHSTSKYTFDIPSLLSLNNDYDKLLEENYMELKMKCLNDLNKFEAENKYQSKLTRELNAIRSRQHLTKVDIKVPSGKSRRSDSTRHIPNGSSIRQLIQKSFSSSGKILLQFHSHTGTQAKTLKNFSKLLNSCGDWERA